MARPDRLTHIYRRTLKENLEVTLWTSSLHIIQGRVKWGEGGYKVNEERGKVKEIRVKMYHWSRVRYSATEIKKVNEEKQDK